MAGRRLRHALERKVNELSEVLCESCDVSSELERVSCRLMRLALRGWAGRRAPPPRWMSCRLLDLLTLTENAIRRRRRRFVDNYQFTSIRDDQKETSQENMLVLTKYKEDETVIKLMDKYQHLILTENMDKTFQKDHCYFDVELDAGTGWPCKEFVKDYKYIENNNREYTPTLRESYSNSFIPKVMEIKDKIERTQAWVNDDNMKVFPYSIHDTDSGIMDSIDCDTDYNTSNVARPNFRNTSIKPWNVSNNVDDLDLYGINKNSQTRTDEDRYTKKHDDKNKKLSKTKLMKKVERKRRSGTSIRKHEYGACKLKSKTQINKHNNLQSTVSKPIPLDIIELCDPELPKHKNSIAELNCPVCEKSKTDNLILVHNEPNQNISATEESVLIDIVMEDINETIALRRNIGTDPEHPGICIQDTDFESVINVRKDDTLQDIIVLTENVKSQTIFLYDINEPSTSKGVRHVGMDVQCGPDSTFNQTKLSESTSLATISKIFTTGIKIGDSLTNFKNNLNFATSTNDDDNYSILSPRKTYPGIVIRDFDIERIKDMQYINYDTSIQNNEKILSIDPSALNIIDDVLSPIKLNTDIFHLNNQHNPQSTDDKIPSTIIESSNYSTSEMLDKEILDFSVVTNISNGTYNVLSPSASNSPKLKRSNTKLLGTYSKTSNDTELNNFTNIQIFQKLYPMIESSNDLVMDSKRMESLNSSIFINTTNSKRYNEYMSIKDCNLDSYRSTQRVNSVASKVGVTETIECCTMTDESVLLSKPLGPSIDFYTETELIKPISSCLKIEYSSSEFNDEFRSSGSLPPVESPINLDNPSKNINELQIETTLNKVAQLDTIKYMRPKLSCGGVHIHSYKDRQVSEDVVFQGEWQRHKSKIKCRKKVCNPIIYRRESVIKRIQSGSKDKITVNKQNDKETKTKVDPKKNLQLRNSKPCTLKQIGNKTDVIKNPPTPNKVVRTLKPRYNKSLTKVSSKIALKKAEIASRSMKRSLEKPSILRKPTSIIKDGAKKLTHSNKKDDVPFHIKINSQQPFNDDKNKLKQNIKSTKMYANSKEKYFKNFSLIRSKAEDIKKDLLQIRNVNRHLKYVVMRNEIEKKSSGTSEVNNKKNDTTAKNLNRRQNSPTSQNSSTCSSPNSIATVRAMTSRSKMYSSKRYASSSKNYFENNESTENSNQNRNKKFVRKYKIGKKSDDKVENTESISGCEKSHIPKKESEKSVSSTFNRKSKNVFVAQFTPDNVRLQPNSLCVKSNVRIDAVASCDDKRRNMSPRGSNKISLTSDYEEYNNRIADENNIHNINVVANIKASVDSVNVYNENESTLIVDNNLNILAIPLKNLTTSERLYSPNLSSKSEEKPILDNTVPDLGSNDIEYRQDVSTVSVAIRRLIEDKLNFIDDLNIECTVDETKTVTINASNVSLLPSSKVSVTYEAPTKLTSNVEFPLNRNFDVTLGNESLVSLADTRITMTDLDLLSFKSLTTVSKASQYFSADNEEDSTNSTSVRDIFERKNVHELPNPAGVLAVQAFSGFSMNAEPLVGDQPDYVNLIDSETGSVALQFTRQATSQEMFVSGRSSESYESCQVDDDTVVPNWLFNIISQQQSMEDVVLPEPLLALGPAVESAYDVNGNAAGAAAGAGAGAGDGRGVHSDRSQDSSGRGTSLSSTDTSTGPQSEAILIDPYSGQYEFLQEPSSRELATPAIVIPLESPDNSFRTADGNESDTPRSTRENHTGRNTANLLQLQTSDIEADVSSIDTDILDSSDN